MTASDRRRYYLAIAICAIDIALCAMAIHVHPDSGFAPSAMGFCIFIDAWCTRRVVKAGKPGVEA